LQNKVGNSAWISQKLVLFVLKSIQLFDSILVLSDLWESELVLVNLNSFYVNFRSGEVLFLEVFTVFDFGLEFDGGLELLAVESRAELGQEFIEAVNLFLVSRFGGVHFVCFISLSFVFGSIFS